MSQEHLGDYLNEFTLGFNRRKSRRRGKLFFRLLQQVGAIKPAPYRSLVKCSANPKFLNHKVKWVPESRIYPSPMKLSVTPKPWARIRRTHE